MRLTHALDDAFASRSYVRVLRALDELPVGLPASARELARRSGLSHPTTSSALASLATQGIVIARRAVQTDAFELNRRHTLTERLRSLFEWERQLPEELVNFLGREIERRAPWVFSAYLFGSSVRGEMTRTSDIDLAVVVPDPGKKDETELALERVADAIRERFGNRLGVTVGVSSINNLRRPGRPGHRLWTQIVQEGIAVIDREKSAGSPRMSRPSHV